KAGYRINISTEQPQRVLGLLHEWDCPAVYLTASREGANAAALTGPSAAESASETAQPVAAAAAAKMNQEWLHATEPGVWITRQGFVGGFRLEDVRLISVTDAELFGQKRKPSTYRRPVAEKSYERFTTVADLKVDDYVVHLKHGIGQF